MPLTRLQKRKRDAEEHDAECERCDYERRIDEMQRGWGIDIKGLSDDLSFVTGQLDYAQDQVAAHEVRIRLLQATVRAHEETMVDQSQDIDRLLVLVEDLIRMYDDATDAK